MLIPDYKSVYANPNDNLEFLTQTDDDRFESQTIERKQVGISNGGKEISKSRISAAREHIEKTMCGFANANGGLLVLGITTTGDFAGIEHLSEKQKSSLMECNSLRGAEIQRKIHKVEIRGVAHEIALFMVESDDRKFCSRIKDDAAWIRQGTSTVRLKAEARELLKRDRRVVEFERANACDFDEQDVDRTVVEEFCKSLEIEQDRSVSKIFRDIGAIRNRGATLEWTNAGLLFFSYRPQRILEHAYIRVVRFDCSYFDEDERPTPDFDQKFDGALTEQIRDLRTFISDSGFFKRFENRSPDGGFIIKPEIPEVVLDEAIVNAVAHRDYGISLPIFCEKYKDAFVVKNPGRLLQPEELPNQFRLNEVRLDSVPRNTKLMEWLRGMQDAKGARYVKALREGTRKMRDEMAKLDLPIPTYKVRATDTTVILENNIEQRSIKPTGLASGKSIVSNEYTNLYRLEGLAQTGTQEREREEKRIILKTLCDKLEANNWIIAKVKMGLATAHKKGARVEIPDTVSKILNIIPAYKLCIRTYYGRYYLVVDYVVQTQTTWRLPKVIDRFGLEGAIDLNAYGVVDGRLLHGRITTIDDARASIYNFEEKFDLPINDVFPNLRHDQLTQVLNETVPNFDYLKELKSASLFSVPSAARQRATLIGQTINLLANTVFPITIGSKMITLANEPLKLVREGDGKRAWRVDQVAEPEVEFGHKRATANIRNGITSFGAYKDSPKELEIVGVVQPGYEKCLRDLVARLQHGSFKFRGTERTFSTQIRLAQVNTAHDISVQEECRRLTLEYPNWSGNIELNRLILVHTPEAEYSVDDVTSPYYQSKRVLLEAGIPCQMVDTSTLINPDYRDLNLALNIVAKSGVTPWVLPESIPDADFFLGLSYTANHTFKAGRVIGFANVFNHYGRWEFYSGGNEAVPYDQRAQHYEKLVENTLRRLNLRDHPTIYFHYSAKFSRIDREAILRGARAVRPFGKYIFVWINTHHPVRLFDARAETDGSVARGRYTIGADNQIYLSTTGYNPYRRVLGTPIALEVNFHVENEKDGTEQHYVDHQSIARQILSLTKLNWASTDSLCSEPITTKYAKNIAYLTAAFQRQNSGVFKLHHVLERTPWFI